MKKWTLLVFLTLICCLLCACDPGTFHIHQETLESVVSVELIQYENPDQNHFFLGCPIILMILFRLLWKMRRFLKPCLQKK